MLTTPTAFPPAARMACARYSTLCLRRSIGRRRWTPVVRVQRASLSRNAAARQQSIASVSPTPNSCARPTPCARSPAAGQELPCHRLQRHHPPPVPHPPSCHRPAPCMCTAFRATGQSWCSWGWREAGEFGKWAVSCHCMFIFISKNLLAVVLRVTSVQQQIHHGWRAPWPPVAPQKSQKSTHFALHFEAQSLKID